ADDKIILRPGHQRGQNVRQAGDDLHRGDRVLAAGRRLNAADLGLLASLGLAEIDARRRPVVAFFSTGDELRGVGQPLDAGQIHDSNRYTLYGLLERAGVEIRDMGVIPDDAGAVREALRTAAGYSDLVITSGGVSVGEADYIKRVLAERGTLHFGRVAVKPGRPLTFGTLERTLFFGLPGNPVSVMATFILFVRRALQRLSGETPVPLPRLKARCRSALRKVPGRMEFQRGILTWAETGELVVDTTGLQDSHVLSSMSKANCFIVLPLESDGVEAGDRVETIPLHGLL
ncbi:MAG: molybdopterin molybdotransferase MoeA, partial [Planctomycetaceae bacterium]